MRKFPIFVFSLNFLYLILIAAECAAIIFLCLYLPACMPVAVAFVVIWLLTTVCVVAVVCRGSSPEINCALALLIVALPVAGAAFFLISEIRARQRGILKFTDCKGGKLQDFGVCFAGYDRATYFESGTEYFPALFKEIERAKKRVYLDYFIISGGKIFCELLSVLKCAKENGAEIKIIIDGLGSAFRVRRKDLKRLKALGAEVKIFHRLTPLACSRLNFRDHRKIAVIDGKVAFTGGINLADEYANVQSPYGYWKDTGVCVYGKAAEVFEGMFLSVWRGSYEMPAPESGERQCLPFYDSPPQNAGFGENLYAAAICSAKERIHIFTPYFCAGEKLSSALAFAAARGVDVRIVLPHIPDKKYAFEVSKTFARPLAAKGVKFYEYTPGFMHAKSMICDDKLFIGSYNLDFRSMRLNFECGVMFDGDIVSQAERDFRESVRLSAPLDEKKISPARKILRFFLKLFAPLV